MRTTPEGFEVLTHCDHCGRCGFLVITPALIENTLESHGFMNVICSGCRKKYTRRLGIMLSIPANVPARYMEKDEEE